MATGYDHIEELPLIPEDGNEQEETKDTAGSSSSNALMNGGVDMTRYSLLGDEDDEEMGVKGVADGDFIPKRDSQIELQKGDMVIIYGQTLDQNCYVVFNLRTEKTGEVPSNQVTPESNEDNEPVPAKSNLQRGNVIRRKRTQSNKDKSRRTGSDYSTSFVYKEEHTDQGLEPIEISPDLQSVTTSLPVPSTHPREALVKSESHVTSLPVQFRRIEKYNVLSVSGSDKESRTVIVFAACRLPPSYQISHDVLFEYIKYTLDKYVESDYTLVYFHYGLSSVNKPSYGWLYQFYKELDRKYKKNLKRLYIVHPTTFVRFMNGLFKPIISYKFGKKVVYVKRLAELESSLYTSQMDIPEEVKQYDRTLRTPRPYSTTESRSSFYVPVNEEDYLNVSSTKQFGMNLQSLYDRTGDEIPLVVRKCVEYLSTETSLSVLGIFRRTPAQFTVQEVKKKFNSGEEVDFSMYADPHLVATTLKMFLRELNEPLLCFETNSKISVVKNVPEDKRVGACRDIIESLPSLNYTVLKYILNFICKVVSYEDVNRMSSSNLSIVFGPNLLWSRDAIASLNSMSEINGFTLLLIDNYNDVFIK